MYAIFVFRSKKFCSESLEEISEAQNRKLSSERSVAECISLNSASILAA